ncbi:ATP/GTP-binding protein [Pseudoxanthomonas mexicana]|uniref:GTP-binding protein n=1 Tax=Pseudoxanthomonas mexicana TaxID=128785 RepID=UPI0007867410|nr:ATP/GTP-binding protein [Pseudoxanthomonas mexicana]
MDNYGNKLVFVGGMGAGKTTAIRAISDVEPVSTDMPLSIDATEEKSFTTVALDYSSIDLDEGELLHVYGVPGQKYLNFMWPMVCTGAIGIIVLVNACQDDAVDSTAGLLKDFASLAPDASFVVGVTKSDLAPDFQLTSFRDELNASGYQVPVMKVDARVTIQVEFLIKTLLSYQHAGAQLGIGAANRI